MSNEEGKHGVSRLGLNNKDAAVASPTGPPTPRALFVVVHCQKIPLNKYIHLEFTHKNVFFLKDRKGGKCFYTSVACFCLESS